MAGCVYGGTGGGDAAGIGGGVISCRCPPPGHGSATLLNYAESVDASQYLGNSPYRAEAKAGFNFSAPPFGAHHHRRRRFSKDLIDFLIESKKWAGDVQRTQSGTAKSAWMNMRPIRLRR